MPTINLLPENLAPTKSLARIANLLKKMAVLVFGVLTISVIVFLAVFIMLNLDLKNSKIRQENLKITIKDLEQTEQGFFLLHDRLAKIKSVRGFLSAPIDLANELNLLLQKTPGVAVSEIKISNEKTSFLAQAATSVEVGNLLENLLLDLGAKKVKLNSFSFNPAAGYLLDLEISK